jgi:hypothetical protein
MTLNLQYVYTIVGEHDFEFTVGVEDVTSISITESTLTVIRHVPINSLDFSESTKFKMITNIVLQNAVSLTYVLLEDYKKD